MRVDYYFNIVVKNVRDTIPKTVGYFLVKAAQEQLQYSLYNEIMRNEDSLGSIAEPAHIAEERDTISKTIAVLQKAARVIKRDPDLQPRYEEQKKM